MSSPASKSVPLAWASRMLNEEGPLAFAHLKGESQLIEKGLPWWSLPRTLQVVIPTGDPQDPGRAGRAGSHFFGEL